MKKVRETLYEKFEQDTDPIADLGIGGFSLTEQIYYLLQKFPNLTNINHMKNRPEIIKYWKKTLENALLNRQVTGFFAKGNEDSWGAFKKYTTPKVKKVKLLVHDPLTFDNMAVLDFALIVDDPDTWDKNSDLTNPNETWYYYSFGDMTKLREYGPDQKYKLYLK